MIWNHWCPLLLISGSKSNSKWYATRILYILCSLLNILGTLMGQCNTVKGAALKLICGVFFFFFFLSVESLDDLCCFKLLASRIMELVAIFLGCQLYCTVYFDWYGGFEERESHLHMLK